jgi:4-hydroxy-tetrahydrodipicolinate synthase
VSDFAGIIVPIITPFAADGGIDFAALREHIDYLIGAGVHGILPAGSTGEALCLSPSEHRALLTETINHVNGRVPVIAGCSANATHAVIANCRLAIDLGADGLLAIHPFYSRPDERELEEHYRAISDSIDRPLIVYNNPHTSGVDALPALLARIASYPHIDYVKESSGDVSRVARLAMLPDRPLQVLCGSDNIALESFSVGATGWVAAIANCIPAECVRLYELAVLQHRSTDALALYRSIYPLLDLAEGTGKFVQVSKAAVELAGRRAGRPRQPLLPLDEALMGQLREALKLIAGPASRG